MVNLIAVYHRQTMHFDVCQSTDIVDNNDPNRADQPQYIVDLIARVIAVSLKTMEVVKSLPEL